MHVRRLMAGLTALSWLTVAAVPAQAERTTLGTAIPVPVNTGFVCHPNCTVAQTALPDASSVTPPAEGRIDAWWAMGKGPGLQVQFRLLHTAAGGQFRAVAHSATQQPTETVTDFPTDLPAQPGDLLGATMSGDGHSDLLESASTTGANINVFSGPMVDGSTQSFTNQFPDRLQLGAEFVYEPVVTGVDDTTGSTAGGEDVVITGNHLTDTTSVRFGTAEADAFTIDSNTRITAVSPNADEGPVDVTVSGPGGTSKTSAADAFTFVAPEGNVSPATVDLGAAPVGGASAAQDVTLANTGTVSVFVDSAAFAGDDSAQFTKFSDGCSGREVAPGSSCSVRVIFTPNSPGVHRTTLRLDDDLDDSPQNVVLVGTAQAGAAPPAAPASVPPSNAFMIGSLKGTRLKVRVASSGTVRVTDTRRRHKLLGPSSAAGGPGTITVVLRLSAKARQTFKRRHRLRIRARVAFTPIGGSSASKTATLVLKAARRKT